MLPARLPRMKWVSPAQAGVPPFSPTASPPRAALWLLAASLLASLAACTPVIGDSCSLSTDCASDGTRICDTAEPGGFCTVLNCTGTNLGASCPDYAICVLFNSNIPGCPLSAYGPARTGQSECRNTCSNNGDCRIDYLCANPADPPWSATVLDPHTPEKICLPLLVFLDGGISPVNYGFDGALDAVPPVCQAAGPVFDAGFPPLDAGVDASPEAASDALAEMRDAGNADAEQHDAAHDASSDAKHDGKVDATVDAGHHDASPDAHDAGHDVAKDAGNDAAKDAAHEAGDAAPKDAAHDGG
jgi:hypothetical protein